MYNEGFCSRHLGNNQRGSPLSFLFDFLLAMQSSPRRRRQEALHHCMIDMKWTGRLKTWPENVRIPFLIYFRLWKYTHGHMHTHTVRMLCFLAFATSESDIFTLAVFCFEYLCLPFRSQKAFSLFCTMFKSGCYFNWIQLFFFLNLRAATTHQSGLCVILYCTFLLMMRIYHHWLKYLYSNMMKSLVTTTEMLFYKFSRSGQQTITTCCYIS